jgi:hypothetical protein
MTKENLTQRRKDTEEETLFVLGFGRVVNRSLAPDARNQFQLFLMVHTLASLRAFFLARLCVRVLLLHRADKGVYKSAYIDLLNDRDPAFTGLRSHLIRPDPG